MMPAKKKAVTKKPAPSIPTTSGKKTAKKATKSTKKR